MGTSKVKCFLAFFIKKSQGFDLFFSVPPEEGEPHTIYCALKETRHKRKTAQKAKMMPDANASGKVYLLRNPLVNYFFQAQPLCGESCAEKLSIPR